MSETETETAALPQKAGEIVAALHERVHHLFHLVDGVKAETFIDTLPWAEWTVYPPLALPPSLLSLPLLTAAQMFLISAEQSRIHFLQATFTPTYLK